MPDEKPLEESVYDTPGVKPYDPESVQPTSTSPAPSSNAPGIGGTSGADGEQQQQPGDRQEQQDQQEEPPLPEFDPRFREEFRGLLYIGALTDTFEWLGHTFVIRTLTTGELAEVALATKPYVGTDAMLKAYQAGVVAASVMSVDGQPMPIPLTTDPSDTPFQNRFRYVMEKWFPPVLDVVYERYYALEVLSRNVIESMGKVSG